MKGLLDQFLVPRGYQNWNFQLFNPRKFVNNTIQLPNKRGICTKCIWTLNLVNHIFFYLFDGLNYIYRAYIWEFLKKIIISRLKKFIFISNILMANLHISHTLQKHLKFHFYNHPQHVKCTVCNYPFVMKRSNIK